QNQVLSARERVIDGLNAIARADNRELLDRYAPARPGPAAPRNTAGVPTGFRDEHIPVSSLVHIQERRFARDGTGCQRGVRSATGRRRREALRWSTSRAREDLIPHAIGPAVQDTVAHQPLLLRTVNDGGARELRIGNETATRK